MRSTDGVARFISKHEKSHCFDPLDGTPSKSDGHREPCLTALTDLLHMQAIVDALLGRCLKSTQRQYALASKVVARNGFARLTAEVALGHVSIVLGLEVSRLARNNADWYRLLDLCGITDTLIGDGGGVYHPAMFNDRLLLGLKGTMSEAELHVLRARLLGGIRNKAARGELRRNLPVGFVWGEQDGEVLFHPDESVGVAIKAVFTRFAELGSVRRVWLWFRSEGLSFPLRMHYGAKIRWVDPS
jgi:DNA invertase Pin-like site-specific DNA recombinase